MKAMTDERARELVEALRELARRRETYSIEAGQAADEIERLRAEVRTLDARLASGRLVMDEQRLAEIEARANAATPGPWECRPGLDPGAWVLEALIADPGPVLTPAILATRAPWEHRAAISLATGVFLAHARQDVPELVAEVKRLRQLVDNNRANTTASMFASDGEYLG